MVINDFNICGIAIIPIKADPPLAVDADAVLSGSIARKPFQSIGGWNKQILE